MRDGVFRIDGDDFSVDEEEIGGLGERGRSDCSEKQQQENGLDEESEGRFGPQKHLYTSDSDDREKRFRNFATESVKGRYH